jgi:hypothetical protein
VGASPADDAAVPTHPPAYGTAADLSAVSKGGDPTDLPAVAVNLVTATATPSRFVLNEDDMNRAILDEYAPRAVYEPLDRPLFLDTIPLNAREI